MPRNVPRRSSEYANLKNGAFGSHRYGLITMLALLLAVLVSGSASVLAASRGIGIEAVQKHQVLTSATGTYRALIIGNDDYRDPARRWFTLSTAVSDANTVARLLKEFYGFSDVQLLENATRKDILLAFNELTKRTGKNDSVLVYYAGHGYLDAETAKGYWIPVDAVGDDYTTFIRNSTIRDELASIAERAQHTLLISDSCFSGSLLRDGLRGAKPSGNLERYYEKVSGKKSVQIITAGGIEFVDDNYNNSGHSPFSYFLINELKHNDRPLLTASELSSNVEKAVANNVEQVPQSGVLQGAGDELGEFIFLNIKIEVQGVPKDKIKVSVDVQPRSAEQPGALVTPAAASESEDAVEDKPESARQVMPLPTL